MLKITNGLTEDVERSRWTPYNKRHGKAPIFGDSMMTAVLHEDLFEGLWISSTLYFGELLVGGFSPPN